MHMNPCMEDWVRMLEFQLVPAYKNHMLRRKQYTSGVSSQCYWNCRKTELQHKNELRQCTWDLLLALLLVDA